MSSHVTVRECFSRSRTSIVRFNECISISSGFSSALGKFTPFLIFLILFLALKYTAIMGVTDISDLKREPDAHKPVPLKVCNCMLCRSLLSEGLIRLLFSVLKLQKVAHFPRAEPKPLDVEMCILNPKIAVRHPEKHFLLQ